MRFQSAARIFSKANNQTKCNFYLLFALLILIESQQINGHIVLTKDDNGQSLVLTGQDGKGGKGGKGGGGDQLVIAGSGMGGGGGQSSNMVMQDAGNREGDVVINGNSMIIPGEDGHIVLADSRSDNNNNQNRRPPQVANQMFAFWLPYMSPRMAFQMMPFFGGGGGGFGFGGGAQFG